MKHQVTPSMNEIAKGAIDRMRAIEESHVRMVLRSFATPRITAAHLSPDAADMYGIGLVYQPTEHLMWVTQHGEQIGPKLSTKITPFHEPANR